MTKIIASVHDCIAALGGTSRAAEFMRVGPSQVSNMLKEGHITSGHHLRVYFRLIREGYTVDTVGVFGVEIDGAIARRPPDYPMPVAAQ